MNHNKSYKFRIYPNKKQKPLLSKTFGCVRFIFNQMLEERIATYDQFKDDKNALKEHKYRTEKQCKQQHEFLKEVDSIALQQSRIDLNVAYKNFFKKQSKFPKFKSKHAKQSYRTININDNVRIKFGHRRIKFPKLGWIKYRDNRQFDDRIQSVTISRTKTGKYFASILIQENISPLLHNDGVVGIDLGLHHFITMSDGTKIGAPKFFRKQEKKVAREQKSLSRKQKGSNNRNKQKIRVARAYEKISNQRNDFLQKLSSRMIKENQIIVIEDLSVKNMLKNCCLSKSISDASWNKFIKMLQYKGDWYGRQVMKTNRFFLSSKKCSDCGAINKELKLSDRSWCCANCGVVHDRDINAAINLKNQYTVGTTEINACGDIMIGSMDRSAQESISFT